MAVRQSDMVARETLIVCGDTTTEENTCCRSSRGRVRIGDDILHSQLSSPLFAKRLNDFNF